MDHSFTISTWSKNPGPGPDFNPGAFDPGKPDLDDERGSYGYEKVKSGMKIPAFLPYYDLNQNVSETAEMRAAYRAMLSDPVIKASLYRKLFSVSQLELNVKPPKRLKRDKRSQQIAEFNDWNIKEGLKGGLPGMVWNILMPAHLDGISINEKVWGGVEQKGRWYGKRRLAKLKPKDVNHAVVPMIDEYGNITSIRGLQFNNGEQFDPGDFVIYQHCPLYGNPGGISDFRAVYGRYWIKDAVWKLRAFACDKRASPLIVGHYSDASSQTKLDAALRNVKSQNWISAPDTAKIEALNIAGQADNIFDATIKALNEEIVMGITGSILSSMTTSDQRGSSLVHKDTADLFAWHLSAQILSILNDHENGLIREITDANFSGVDEYPTAIFGGIDDAELKESILVDEALIRVLQPMGKTLDIDELEDRYGRKIIDAPQPAGGMPPGMPGAPPGGVPVPGGPDGVPAPGAPGGGQPAPMGQGGPDGGNGSGNPMDAGGGPGAAPASGGQPGQQSGQQPIEDNGDLDYGQASGGDGSNFRNSGKAESDDDMGDPAERANLIHEIMSGAMAGDRHHQFDESTWVHDAPNAADHQRSQRRWRNSKTGEIVYADNNPGGSRGPAAYSQAAGELPAPTGPVPTVNAGHDKTATIEKHAKDRYAASTGKTAPGQGGTQQQQQAQPQAQPQQPQSLTPLSQHVTNLVASHQHQAEGRGDAAIEKIAQSSSEKPEEIRTKLQKAFDAAEVTVNFDPAKDSSVKGIFGTASLKSAYHTKSRADDKGYMETRRRTEDDAFGANKSTPDEERPLYAAVNWRPGEKMVDVAGAAPAYGGASIVLNKDAIKGRTTLTPHDSFSARDQSMTGTLEHPMAALANNAPALAAAGIQHNNGNLDKGYTEAQIWGGQMPLNAGTVKEIRLPSSHAHTENGKQIQEFCQRTGIKLRIFDAPAPAHQPAAPRKKFLGLFSESDWIEELDSDFGWMGFDELFESKHPRAHGKFARKAERAERKAKGDAWKESRKPGLMHHLAKIGAAVGKPIGASFSHAHAETKKLIDEHVSKLPPILEKPIRWFWGAYSKVANSGNSVAKKAVEKIAQAKGLDKEKTEHLTYWTSMADWTVQNIVGWTGKLVGMGGVAKTIGGYMPLGSLAYLAGAAAANPVSTLKHAAMLVGRVMGSMAAIMKFAEDEGGEFADVYAEWLAKQDDPDLASACFLHALDRTDGKWREAIDVADKALAANGHHDFAEDDWDGPDVDELQAAGDWLHERNDSPDYGSIYAQNGTGRVWFVSADGNGKEFCDLVDEKLSKINGVKKVTIEAECLPRAKEGGWLQVWPKIRKHVPINHDSMQFSELEARAYAEAYEADIETSDDPETLRAAFVMAFSETGGDWPESWEIANDVVTLADEFMQFDEADWRKDPGPRSPDRWRNVKTGKLKYSKTNPGKVAGKLKAAKAAPKPYPMPSAEHITSLFDLLDEPAEKPKKAKAEKKLQWQPTDEVSRAQEEWWDKSLTGAGRSDILKAAGLKKVPVMVKYRHMSDEQRRAVDHMRPSEFRPEDRAKAESGYQDFANKYRAVWDEMVKATSKYKPGQIGFDEATRRAMAEMARMSDEHPEWAERAEAETHKTPKVSAADDAAAKKWASLDVEERRAHALKATGGHARASWRLAMAKWDDITVGEKERLIEAISAGPDVKESRPPKPIPAQFIGKSQSAVLRDGLKGEEADFFRDKIAEMNRTIESMPKTYDQDGKGENATVYLHYFTPGGDWYITEKDVEADQNQAFGLANPFGDGGELGYISLPELVDAGAELDLHWTPKTIAEIRGKKAEESPAKPAAEAAPALIGSDDVVRTKSGRHTSPHPAVDMSTDRRAANSIKRQDAWLKQEALAEIAATPDKPQNRNILGQDEAKAHQKRMVESIDLNNITQSDRDTLNLILFGDPQGPKAEHIVSEGDRNAEGLVFHNGRWHREEPDQTGSNRIKPDSEPDSLEPAAGTGAAIANAHLELSKTLAERLADDKPVTRKELQSLADAAHAGTQAEGKYGPSDMYDSLEAGFNQSLMGKTDPTVGLKEAIDQAERVADQVGKLPTQTNRSGNKIGFQQFSTPPHYAYAVAWLANIKPGQTVVEPSAGTGCIAVQAKNAGANVYANEYDERRAAFLKSELGDDHVMVGDALQLYATHPELRPDVVVMNPPFSQTAGRMGNRKNLMEGANHITEALKMLKPGGRLVAIVAGGINRKDATRGAGMSPDAPYYREWFNGLARSGYTLKANVGVSGNEYKKYGTDFDTRVLVIDKLPAAESTMAVTGNVDTIPDLMALLEDVRNERNNLVSVAEDAGGKSDLRDVRELPAPSDGAADPHRTNADAFLAVGDVAGDGEGRDGVEPVAIERPGNDLPAEPEKADDGSGVSGGRSGGARRRGPGKRAGTGKSGSERVADAAGGKTPKRGKSGGGRKSAADKLDPVFALRIPELRPSGPVKLLPRPSESIAVANVKPPKPHFTGIDANGHKWVDGKMVALTNADLTTNIFEDYKPSINVAGMKMHTTPLVESAAMASVNLPPITYAPVLSPDLVEQKVVTETRPDGTTFERELGLSAAALENVALMGQAHSRMLPPDANGISYRMGMMVGDGAGSGKGRQIAGVIIDNENQGRKRHVWLSKNEGLISDARRDYADLGGDPSRLVPFDAIRGKNPPKDCILFVPYTMLSRGPKDKAAPRNVDELIRWMGPDFDGVVAFDEAHAMANSTATKSDSGIGSTQPSQQALAGIAIQRAVPNARVGYWTATAATEPTNLLYAERLGLWGPGTEFADKGDFVQELVNGGTATMESTAQTMKALGVYNARQLSMDDKSGRVDPDGSKPGVVENMPLMAKLSEAQRAQYDAAADAWQHVLQNMDKVIEDLSGGNTNKMAKQAAHNQFWGAEQRFFNQVLTAMAMPSLIAEIDKDLEAGRAPVVQIVNTMAASTERALKNRDQDQDLDEVDVSPSEILVNFLNSSFPTERYEEYLDADGNKGMRLVRTPAKANQDFKYGDHPYKKGDTIPRDILDDVMKHHSASIEGGSPVEDPDAVAKREELKLYVRDIRIPESPLDQLVKKYGDQFAEVTGRSGRFNWQTDEDGNLKKVWETRSDKANAADVRAFMNAEKKVLAFSGAGNTGASYHADKRAKNQGRRVHYVLQAGWSATPLIQSLGRCHRTNESSAPIVRPVGIPEVPGHKRFVSSATRRAESMGALTRGQKGASGGGVYSGADNLETKQAEEGLERFIRAMDRGAIHDLDYRETMNAMGYETEVTDPKTGITRPKQGVVKTNMRQFMNRLLCLKLDKMSRVFEAFDHYHQQAIKQAEKEGTLDKGVENYKADKVEHQETVPIWKDPVTGAEASLVTVKTKLRQQKRQWSANEQGELPLKFVINERSGQPWAVYKAPNSTDVITGDVVPHYIIRGPRDQKNHIPVSELDNEYTSNYKTVSTAEAKDAWEKSVASTPDFKDGEAYFVTGATLPIWKKIPLKRGSMPQVYRLKPDNGRAFVGREVPAEFVDEFKKKMGLGVTKKTFDVADIHRQLEARQVNVHLENGWKLKPVTFSGQTRIEVIGPSMHDPAVSASAGIIREVQNGRMKFFVPTGASGPAVLAKLTEGRPIERVNDAE